VVLTEGDSRLRAVERLEKRYREHHRARRSPDLVYGGEERASVFRELVGGPGRRVLDLGCRYGALTRAYLEGNEVVGLDVDREALAEAAKLGIQTRWADVEQPLELDDASFDVVVAGELLEHVRDPEAVVAEAQRVVKPGGRFVGSVPNAYRAKNRLRFLLGRAPERDPTHLHMYAPRQVRALLRGWEDVELRFIAGRLVPLNARLFANDVVFSARKPG
jgi:2-polyprenyl-3-methyl-5-hydroxy-6-metoxy-1,4-benzoquinol methylase